MAWQFTVNQTPVATLMLAGWTMQDGGTGTAGTRGPAVVTSQAFWRSD